MSVPAVAVAGPLLLMVRSADADTVAGAVWLLLFGFGSALLPLTVAVLLSAPLNAGLMFAVSVNWADAPAASGCNEQFTEPGVFGAGVPQVAVTPVFCTNELNVVPAGSVSNKEGLGSGSPAELATVIVHAIVPPAVAVPGPIFVTARSLLLTMSVVVDSLLLVFGSGVGAGSAVELTSATLVNSVPDGVPGGM